MKDHNTDIAPAKSSTLAGRIAKVCIWLIFAVLLLLFIVILLFQIPYLQKKAADLITERLSKKWNTEVSVNGFEFSISDGAVVSNFFVGGLDQDTMIYAHHLNVSWGSSLKSLLYKEINLSNIVLDGAVIRVINNAQDGLSNFDVIFASDKPDIKDERAASPLDVSLDQITLTNADVSITDQDSEDRIAIKLDDCFIDVDVFDLKSNQITIDEIVASQPSIVIIQKNDKPKPDAINPDEIRQLPSVPLDVRINNIKCESGQFTLSSRVDIPLNSISFDYKNFGLSQLNFETNNLVYVQDSLIRLGVDEFNVLIDEKFTIKNCSFDSLIVMDRSINIDDLRLATNRSTINQSLLYSYDQLPKTIDDLWNDEIQLNFSNSSIAQRDLMYFLPSLKELAFFKNKGKTRIDLNGTLTLSDGNLRSSPIKVALDQASKFLGAISIDNIANEKLRSLDLRIDSLVSNINELRRIIPGFNPPNNFDKLGAISLSGQLVGPADDVKALGNLYTDLGEVILDVTLDLSSGLNQAGYEGQLSLRNFDIGEWTDNAEFGQATLITTIKDGYGLKGDIARATVNAELEKLVFKEYEYSNAQLTGIISEKQFNGAFNVIDDHVDLSFKGVIDLSSDVPKYDFKAFANRLELNALNLSKDTILISGALDVAMVGKDLNSLEGKSQIQNFELQVNDKSLSLAEVEINSRKVRNGMSFSLSSELLNLNVDGIFDLRDMHLAVLDILDHRYPYHFEQLGLTHKRRSQRQNDKYHVEVEIVDSKDVLALAGVQDLRLQDVRLSANVDLPNDLLDFTIRAPAVAANKDQAYGIFAQINASDDGSGIKLLADSLNIAGIKTEFLNLNTSFINDSIQFDIKSGREISGISSLNLLGKLIPHPRGYELTLDEQRLHFLDKDWKFDQRNSLAFGKQFIDIQNFKLNDGYRFIELFDVDNEGIDLRLRNFDLDLANETIGYDKMWFSGESLITARVENLFDKPDIEAHVFVPDFRINDDPWGSINIDAIQKNDSIIDVDFIVRKEIEQFFVHGYYNTASQSVYSDIKVSNFPLRIFEYIIPNGISNTAGNAHIEAIIQGPLDDLDLNGQGRFSDAQVKVDYLGATYFMDEQRIDISDEYVSLEGAILKDERNNTARFTGGIRHDFFADFQLDANLSSERFIGLNTTKKDNPVYYGFAQGKLDVYFRNTFNSADIQVDCVTGPGTDLSFPITSTQSNYNESFIEFINPERDSMSSEKEKEFKIEGLDFEMNVSMTEDANVRMIFDERFGNILEGHGRGDLSLFIKRNGDFDVFGNFQVSDGRYLYTSWGVIAKPFILDQGGTVQWTGDPFDASLDISASYTGIRAPLDVFLAEYLTAARSVVIQEAQSRRDVELKLLLGGTLFNPDINFDIAFSDLAGELKSYVDSKMELLRATENGINNQVVGLLVFRSFLPFNNPLNNISSGNILSTGSNTLTEFITSQLGLLVGDAIQSRLSDESFVQGVDVNIGLSENTGLFSTGNTQESNLLPDELDINVRNTLRNGWIVSIGGNYVWQNNSTTTNQDYLEGDLSLERPIPGSLNLNLKFYGKLDFDEITSTRRDRYGLGLRFRREFGRISRFDRLVDDVIKGIEDADNGR